MGSLPAAGDQDRVDGAGAAAFPNVRTDAPQASLNVVLSSTVPCNSALSAKRNLIATLTGTSHERLQLFHRWFAFYMLILALIHTFAFVRYNALAKMSVMMWETSYEYWTGVAALVPQAWLTLMSLAPIR